MGERLDFIWEQLPNLIWGFPSQRPGGLLLSILLSAGATALGFALAVALAFAHHSPWRVVRIAADRLIWAVRGIPLLVLLVLLHQLLVTGTFGFEVSTFWAAFLILALYAGVYLADVLGAGIAAVPQQLLDDSRILGAGPLTLARTVTIPYALRTMKPALTTQAITVFKDSSVVVILGVAELTTTAGLVLGSDTANQPNWLAIYLTVGALYWIVAWGLSRVVN